MSDYLTFESPNVTQSAKNYLIKVYLWMTASLFTTAAVAWYSVLNDSILQWVLANAWLPIIATLGIVIVMSFAMEKLSSKTLIALLAVFSIIEGLILGPVMTQFSPTSIALAFLCTGGTFGAMAIYGYTTKADLSSLGSTLLMVLIGLIIAMIANFFLASTMLDYAISAIGVIAFSIFTAFDTQNILRIGNEVSNEEDKTKLGVLGALSLYLDFLNLFLLILRLVGINVKND